LQTNGAFKTITVQYQVFFSRPY